MVGKDGALKRREQLKKLVIIPAFNEEPNIIKQYREVREKAPDYDVIVVNDGSLDGTLRVCLEEGITVLDHALNLGIGGAMQTGYRYAALHGYDIAAQVDGDGQHDPVYLNDMCEALLDENADMIIGSRFIKGEGDQSTALRRGGIRYFSFLIRKLTGCVITDPTSGFRMAGRKLIGEFAADYPQDYPEPESVVRAIALGRKVVEVPVKMRERSGGRTSIGAAESVYYMIKVTAAIILERIRMR